MRILVNGLKVNYRIMGEGRPFLILHGWGSNSERWQRVGELLTEKNLKVIIPDLPGFGMSQEPPRAWGLDDYCDFVEKFTRSLNLEKFYLLGHSFGGAIASKYAIAFPKQIEKLFLVGAASIRKKTFKKRLLFTLSKIFKPLSSVLLLRKAFYKFIVKSDYLDSYLNYTNSQGVMKNVYLKTIKEDLSEELKKINVFTVIIWGEKDNITPLKYGKIINSNIKNSKLIVIPKGGHNLKKEMPEFFAQKINENIY